MHRPLSVPSLSAVALAATLSLAPGWAVAGGSLSAPLAANVIYSLDVSGIDSMDDEGSVLNEVRTLQIGAGSRVVGMSWDVTLTAFEPSWLSELIVSVGPSAGPALYLFPGNGDDVSGAGVSYSSGGLFDLASIGLDFTVGADGVLRLEFFEDFDDVQSVADGRWVSGSLGFEVTPVPEPATYGLMALGLLGVAAAARRRRLDA